MQLLVRLGLDATGYETGLKKAKSAARSFGHELSNEVGGKIASVFGAAAIEEGVRRTVEWADKLKNLSLRTGIPVEELQKLEYAAEMTETSLESVVKAVEKFGKSQAQARKEGPGSDKFEAFKRMGLTDQDINSGDYVANFYKAAEHMKGAEQSAQLVADWTSIAGKNAMEIAPAMREGFAGFASEMEKMGAVVPVDEMVKLAEAADDFKRIMIGLRALLAVGFGNKGAGFMDEIAIALVGAAEFARVLASTGSLKQAHQASKEIEAEAHEGLALKHDELVKQLSGKGDKDKHPTAETDPDKKARAAEAAELKKIQSIHERIEEIRRRTGLIGIDATKLKKLNEEIAAAQPDARDTGLHPGLKDAEREEKLAKLEEDRARLMATMDKKGSKELMSALKPEHNSLIDIGNYLGGVPTGGVESKLDVVHTDLRELIRTVGGRSDGINFPSS